jgi:hypothetical protein
VHVVLDKNKRIAHILRDIYAPCCLRKIVVHEAYIPYRFVDGVTENADIPMPECDDGGGETEGYANRRAGCANYDGEITKRGRTRACTSDLILIIVDCHAE